MRTGESIDQTASFGHDIEASWLLWEAAERLGLSDLAAEARQCALRLADSTLARKPWARMAKCSKSATLRAVYRNAASGGFKAKRSSASSTPTN